MKFITPVADEKFSISEAPKWPKMLFKTDAKGPHTWHWNMSWRDFEKNGVASTHGNEWDAAVAVVNLGGKLSVRAQAGKSTATIAVELQGSNPTQYEVTKFLEKEPNANGFGKILAKESKFEHFSYGQPIKSFDNGFGMCQLTTPRPQYIQVWNWKLNVQGGLALYAQKKKEAITYLSQDKRTYTDDQLLRETVSRWNGGSYHEWKNDKWQRKDNVLCDSLTGNIGWDMSDKENRGKTESKLRDRDKAGYSKAPTSKSHWMYSGVCYADQLLR